MPNPEGLRINIGETKFTPGGSKVSAVAIEDKPQSLQQPSSTARHEANHAVLAERNGTSVIDATVIPGPGYLGLTRLSRPDAIAAVGPHADGMGGTGHDVRIARLMGHHEASIGSIAKKIANENKSHIHAVATELDKKGTLGGSEIRSIIKSVDSKKENPVRRVEIFIKNENGDQRKIEINSSNKTVMIPNTWYEVSNKPNKTDVANDNAEKLAA